MAGCFLAWTLRSADGHSGQFGDGRGDLTRPSVKRNIGARNARPAVRALRRASGFPTLELTDDGLAKEHLRHLVGGRSPLARDEHLYRFEFPERPGALVRFLASISPAWNISLFHYRIQGRSGARARGSAGPAARSRPAAPLPGRPRLPPPGRERQPAYQLFLR